MDPPPIGGTCDERFAPVRDAFTRNFIRHDELGAACCVYVDGESVVDLWGGYRDLACTRPWGRDTLVGFYSVSKAFLTLCALHLRDTTDLRFDDPAARWWPEFGSAGKASTTVRDLLTHRAGLPAIRKLMPEGSMLDWEAMVQALAEEEPWWRPGGDHGCHINTSGFLIGEVVRRVSGLTLGSYLRRHITDPLGADLAIGLRDGELERVAELDWQVGEEAARGLDLNREMSEEERMITHAYANPSGLSSRGVLNTRAWRQAEVPSTNGHGTARGVARVFAALARGGELDDIRIVAESTLKEATLPQAVGVDKILRRDMRWGLGFQLTHSNRPLGPNPHSFGHFGHGGSLGFADPTAGIGFGYVMNRLVRNWTSRQNQALLEALYQCI